MNTLLILPIADVAFAFKQSNLSGQIIVIILFVGSILAWSVMLTKFRELRTARVSSRSFLVGFRREEHPVALFIKKQRYAGSPLYAIYEKACTALGAELEQQGAAEPVDLFMAGGGDAARPLSEAQINVVRGAADRTVANCALILENSMGFLAIATTTAPFLGLLGTVWGVMDAFGGMAVSGSAMLSAVAPGISGALLTTVVGLVVALPSAIGYNVLSDQIRRINVEMENFSQELVSRIEQHYLHQG